MGCNPLIERLLTSWGTLVGNHPNAVGPADFKTWYFTTANFPKGHVKGNGPSTHTHKKNICNWLSTSPPKKNMKLNKTWLMISWWLIFHQLFPFLSLVWTATGIFNFTVIFESVSKWLQRPNLLITFAPFLDESSDEVFTWPFFCWDSDSFSLMHLGRETHLAIHSNEPKNSYFQALLKMIFFFPKWKTLVFWWDWWKLQYPLLKWKKSNAMLVEPQTNILVIALGLKRYTPVN